MLIWLLGGIGTAAVFVIVVIRNAEADDRAVPAWKAALPARRVAATLAPAAIVGTLN